LKEDTEILTEVDWDPPKLALIGCDTNGDYNIAAIMERVEDFRSQADINRGDFCHPLLHLD
jgi:hypothetical protein